MPTLAEMLSERARAAAQAVRDNTMSVEEADRLAREQGRAVAQEWLQEAAQNSVAEAGVQQYPPTSLEIIEQRERQRALERVRQYHREHPEDTEQAHTQQAINLEREIQAQRDIRIDPEINRIAKTFYTALMQRIHFEFGHYEPDWDSQLGAREKKIWLEATELLLYELKKEPVAKTELGLIAKRRIIS